MRLKKGSKVEVLNMRELPSGSWQSAKIISGNGHTYSVVYDCNSPDMGGSMERVPRKAIRPRPPPVECPMGWVLGNIVEVCKKNSWKLAQVSSVVGGNYFVRPLGSSDELLAHACNLRVPQTWQGDKWVVMRKELGKCEDVIVNSISKTEKCNPQMLHFCIEVKDCEGDDQFPNIVDNGFEGHCRSLKKKRHLPLPLTETCNGASRKTRAVEKEGRRHRLVEWHPSQLLKEVDAVASPCSMLGEKYMHTSVNHKAPRFRETDMDRRKHNANSNDSKSNSSSVGSCSASDSPYRPLYHSITSPIRNLYSHSDEVEPSCVPGREPSLPAAEGLTKEIHRLELYAYHSTLSALHASGPLSWEKEALITNLRLMLHISNDEHLLELKHLASAKSDIHHC